MAEAISNELVKVLVKKMTDEAFKRIARAQGIHKELKELKSTLSRVQDLLTDASEKEVTEKSVKSWLNGLQHLAYDIDDVLDDLATEDMHRELTLQEPAASTSMVRKLMPSCCTNFSLSHRLSPKLDSITTKLQQLEKQNPGLTVKGEKPKHTNRRNETSLPDGSSVIGREVEKEKLLNKLLGDDGSSKENFSIVPIVGMGGVGKTTLARLLYNDTKVQNHFELHVWICVSDDFDIFKISKIMFENVSRENKKFEDLNQLHMALTNQLNNKRFLLVLDDVWHENENDWENLVRPFHSCAPGSRIIMTTRKEELLKNLRFGHIDSLKSLSHEDALSIFALHALGVENFSSHATLKPHGEGIVKKCAGLPLALKAIGKLLWTRTNVEDWEDVLNSEIWNLENSDKIVPALRLSYQDLSADLKQLFAYCSLFPKDYLFDKEELVLLWIAEGFLDPLDTTKSLERLGNEYFDVLLSRSFFQHAPNDESLFMMHDLMNDLSTFVAGEFFLRFENHMIIHMEALEKHRHMSFTREQYVGHQKFEAFKRARSLRTFLAVSVGVEERWKPFYLSSKILVDLLPTLPLLRVLSLSRFKISELPEFIGRLKHLRYLNLSQTKIVELPENVENLYHLQTLIVFGCESLTKLPKSFKKLKKLRHFDIRGTPLLKKLPLGICELESLQTLTRIIIGGDDGLEINELKGLKNLHCEVSIEGLNKVQSAIHTRKANLSLKRITGLELQWVDEFDDSRMSTLVEDVLNELEPNKVTLKKLSIVSYGGTEFSNWVGDRSFHQLVNVSIRGCRKCISLPPFGLLPSLKCLLIQGMDEVKVIGLEVTGSADVAFPSLKVLRIKDMLGWEEWSTKNESLVAVFPCLEELHVKRCPKLIDVSLQALPLLKVLEIEGCGDGLLRRVVQVASSITKLEIEVISGLTDEVWRGVIENLGAVEELSIKCCNEIRYMWESNVEASKVFVKLKELKISYCQKMVSLGEKEEDEDNIGSNLLSSLRKLEIESCKSMERLCCPNSIESLDIRWCDSVRQVSFPGATTTGEGGQNLKSLTIYYPYKEMEKINNTSMPMLQAIDIRGWKNLKTINELSNSTHLTSLSIYNCESMESFSDLQLSNLTRLYISGCESIESIRNLQLPNLTHMYIGSCKNMKEIRDLQIPNLISWSIQYCENVESIPELELCNLTLLRILRIIRCPMIEASFPGGIWPPNLVSLEIGGLKRPISEWGYQNFPASLVHLGLWNEADVRNISELSHLFPSSLTSLTIYGFKNLESVSKGLQHLTSLQHLYISYCPEVKDLPETLLPTLLSLIIGFECPKLKERCEGRGSHYWPLISHIPQISMDWQDIS